MKKTYAYVHSNNAKIIFSFSNGMTMIRFSIPKLLNGNNFDLAGRKDINYAVNMISILIGLDLREFKISRIDITSNFESPFTVLAHKDYLARPSKFRGITEDIHGFYYHINEDFKLSSRIVSIYQKQGRIRIEVRLVSCLASTTSVSGMIKRFIKHEPEVKELIKESFYVNCVKHYTNVVGTTLRGKKLNGLQLDVREKLYTNLRMNYLYTFNRLVLGDYY